MLVSTYSMYTLSLQDHISCDDQNVDPRGKENIPPSGIGSKKRGRPQGSKNCSLEEDYTMSDVQSQIFRDDPWDQSGRRRSKRTSPSVWRSTTSPAQTAPSVPAPGS